MRSSGNTGVRLSARLGGCSRGFTAYSHPTFSTGSCVPDWFDIGDVVS